MASIDKRPDGRYRARWREHPGGPQHAKHFDRKADAERFLDQVRGDLARGLFVDPDANRIQFGEFAESWRRNQVHRPTTAALVDTYLRHHILPFFGDRPIGTIRPSDVQAWVSGRAAVLAPTTVKVIYRFTSAIFRAAVQDPIIAISPCDRIRLPPVPRHEIEPLETAAVMRLAAAVPTRYRALVLVTAASGLRQGEVFGLEIRHINFERPSVHVDQQITTINGRTSIAPPKTPASVRTVPIPHATLEQLKHHINELGLTQRERGRLLFTSERGEPIQRNRFGDLWRRAVHRADLPAGTGFHALRHYYASLLIRQGESVSVVQARLGHSSAAQTLDTYSHLWPDAADRTREAVDTVLGEALRHSQTIQRKGLGRSIEPPGLGL